MLIQEETSFSIEKVNALGYKHNQNSEFESIEWKDEDDER